MASIGEVPLAGLPDSGAFIVRSQWFYVFPELVILLDGASLILDVPVAEIIIGAHHVHLGHHTGFRGELLSLVHDRRLFLDNVKNGAVHHPLEGTQVEQHLVAAHVDHKSLESTGG